MGWLFTLPRPRQCPHSWIGPLKEDRGQKGKVSVLEFCSCCPRLYCLRFLGLEGFVGQLSCAPSGASQQGRWGAAQHRSLSVCGARTSHQLPPVTTCVDNKTVCESSPAPASLLAREAWPCLVSSPHLLAFLALTPLGIFFFWEAQVAPFTSETPTTPVGPHRERTVLSYVFIGP